MRQVFFGLLTSVLFCFFNVEAAVSLSDMIIQVFRPRPVTQIKSIDIVSQVKSIIDESKNDPLRCSQRIVERLKNNRNVNYEAKELNSLIWDVIEMNLTEDILEENFFIVEYLLDRVKAFKLTEILSLPAKKAVFFWFEYDNSGYDYYSWAVFGSVIGEEFLENVKYLELNMNALRAIERAKALDPLFQGYHEKLDLIKGRN